ncbi:MAG: ABC transporter ATP-binding protein [Spirochaetes bacterium]|nr:ABC transporter ATP-binding protein [Spirochaetota bacterium]MBN2769938.1 ABC transporter ATP-binding protein [Spirochaetota bacterium]
MIIPTKESLCIGIRFCTPLFYKYSLWLFLISLLSVCAAAGNAWLLKQLYDNALSSLNLESLYKVSALYLLVSIIISLIVLINQYITKKAGLKLNRAIRKELTSELVRYDYQFFLQKNSNEITARIFENTDNLSINTVQILLGYTSLFSIIIWSILLFNFARWLFYIYIATVLLVILWAILWAGPINESKQNITRLYRLMYQSAFRIIINIKTIKFEVLKNNILKEFNNILTAVREQTLKQSHQYTIINGIIIPSYYIYNILLMYYGSKDISSDRITIGFFTFILIILGNILIPLNDLQKVPQALLEIQLILTKMRQYRTGHNEKEGSIELEHIKQGISFVDCSLVISNRTIFSNISLDIYWKDHMALIGKSGSGKSALMKLLLRLYHSASGSILIDGKDVQQFTLESLRKRITIIPQEISLYPVSLKENIDIHNRLKSDQMHSLLDNLRLLPLLSQLPCGLNTIVSETFSTFSEGEKQRIGIARGLSLDADVFIFDECTSHLDPETAFNVVKYIKSACQNKTIIFISHNLRLAGEFEKLILMRDGALEEMDVSLYHDNTNYLKSMILQ